MLILGDRCQVLKPLKQLSEVLGTHKLVPATREGHLCWSILRASKCYSVELHKKAALSILLHLPKASGVEWLTALKPRLQVLKIISELLIFSKLHHVIEVLHMLHHCVQLVEGEWG